MVDDTQAKALVLGSDGRPRCFWGASTPEYERYHDDEWGRPVLGDDAMFERMSLEAFQSGLSWLTILRKRDNFRAAFAGFSIERVALFDDRDRERLMADPGIVRNRLKIDAVIANARAAADMLERGESLSALVWAHRPADSRPAPRTRADLEPTTPESQALAKELKRRGFRFVGPTTAYAAMQACGVVNDHLDGCCAREAVERERREAIAAL